jgi:hypothetical protein
MWERFLRPFGAGPPTAFKDYRPIFFGGFLLIGVGFLSFALIKDAIRVQAYLLLAELRSRWLAYSA